eukprot:287640_1
MKPVPNGYLKPVPYGVLKPVPSVQLKSIATDDELKPMSSISCEVHWVDLLYNLSTKALAATQSLKHELSILSYPQKTFQNRHQNLRCPTDRCTIYHDVEPMERTSDDQLEPMEPTSDDQLKSMEPTSAD